MAWTDPTGHIYAVSEIVTAATLNTYVEADISYLYGDAGWTAPTFTNSWVNFGGVYMLAGFRQVAAMVEVRGSIAGGTIGQAAWVLPVAYRPGATCQFAVQSNALFGIVAVGSNGNVVPISGSNVSVGLDGIHWSLI